MKQSEAILGTRVKTNRPFVQLPTGTEGVIYEDYDGGIMVAWDLPDNIFPENWEELIGKYYLQTGILRDGFSYDELDYLELV